MAVLSEFETEGVWCIIGGGLVHDWSKLQEFKATEFDVPFGWNPEYNWGIHEPRWQQLFQLKYRILKINEIVEVFREPFNDIDGSFKGRSFLVANFRNETDAIFFKIAMSQF